MRPERFHLLFVCTANVCRSPMAAELTRLKVKAAACPEADGLIVDSAGTRGHDGAGMDPGAAAVLHSRGGYTADFRARTVTAPLIAEADLVLTADRRQRAESLALHPRSHAKVFTILEFARLVRHVDPGRLADDGVASSAASLVREAARMRGRCPPGPTHEDIADPYQGPDEEYRACAATIEKALDRPLKLILPRSS